MPRWTRRDLVKAAVATSATIIGNTALPAEAVTRNEAGSKASDPIAAPPIDNTLRETFLMDANWRFSLGNACDPAKDFGFGKTAIMGTFAKSGNPGGAAVTHFDDSTWQQINLPHDWAVDLPFVLDNTVVWHGGKPLGRAYPETSIGWYRKLFPIPASDLGKRIRVRFDGVYRNAQVFLNGEYLGQDASGYAPFEYDVTDFLNYGGDNLLALRVDATFNEGWFYEGAGIYRHVWLTRTAPVHIASWGNYVQSNLRSGINGPASLLITSEIENTTGKPATCTVHASVIDPNGTTVATAHSRPATVAAASNEIVEMETTVARPELWSPETPHLYRLVATVLVNGKAVDQDATTFGIRSTRFDGDEGFFMNDKPIKIKGTCNHQDHAGLGVALPDRIQSYRIECLKAMGSNAYRTSHNAPTPELLDACDRLGMLVMDETREFSSSPQALGELERMVKRDRNHPSIILWSIANEEPQQGTDRGARMGRTMMEALSRLDTTRPITAAMNHGWGSGLSNVVDVQGFNYNLGDIDAYRKAHPTQPLIGTETASTVSTRGIYANDPKRGYVAAYDNQKPHYAEFAEEWWKFYDDRQWLSGGFVWTGFDYRGEPSPYHLPCISSHYGVMDTCGFPKDNYFYYHTWWRSEPALHLFPHWNWSGKEGQPIEVWCYSNQQSVELFLNGKSLGSQNVEKNGHLVWQVPYTPGTIEARASSNGKITLTAQRETTGPAAKIKLQADRTRIQADGEDVSVISVTITDAEDRMVPTADNKVHFTLTGAGQIIAVGNGDPSCYEPDHATERSAFNGLCMCIVQSSKTEGALTLLATSPGLEDSHVVIEAAPATPRPALT